MPDVMRCANFVLHIYRMLQHITTIKSRPKLDSLNSEHRDSLLFCWRIKQGLADGTSTTKLRDLAVHHWNNHLKPHFLREEEVILPFILNQSLAEQFKQDHTDIRELILALHKNPTLNAFPILTAFIANHIRFEERCLFSYLEKILSEEQFYEMEDKLRLSQCQ